ncbi:hypothetical protein BCR36DRAFT_243441, partial [Piromyces finnis]
MNFEDTNAQNSTATNIDDLKQTQLAADFINKNNSINISQNNDEKNIKTLNSAAKTGSVSIMDQNVAQTLNLQSKTSATEDILFRNHTISHSNHRPHPQALRELSAIVNGIGMNNGLNVNNISNPVGLGNSVNSMNTIDKNFIKPEPAEEYNLFNNRTFSNANMPITSNNNWSHLQWNNYLNGSNKGTSFSLINKKANPTTSNNSSHGLKSENNGSSFKVKSLISNSNSNIVEEEKEKSKLNSVSTSPIASTISTSGSDPVNNISASSSLKSTNTTSTQDFNAIGLGSNPNTSSIIPSNSNLNVPSLFNPTSKSFSPLINDGSKNESNSLMHSDSDITLISSHVSANASNNVTPNNTLNGSITSPNGINAQTPLIKQFSKLSLDNSKTSPTSNMYNNIFFNNDSEQNGIFHGSPINNNSASEILRHNSLPVSSNTSLLISSERESDLSHLNNDIELLIRSSQFKFEDLIKYKDKLSNPNIPLDMLNHIKKDLLIQGWYQHAYYSIRKIKDRLQDIFKLNPSVWMVDIDIYYTGDIDITLYYFKLHIHTCYDLKNCIVSEWRGNRYTEISNWWASASLLFNQILLLFKLSETTIIKPITPKVHIEDKPNV